MNWRLVASCPELVDDGDGDAEGERSGVVTEK